RRAKEPANFVTASHLLPCHMAANKPRRAGDQRGHATLTLPSLAWHSRSGRTPAASAPGVVRWPLTTGSTSREKDSHHLLPISFRASSIFCCKSRSEEHTSELQSQSNL